MFGYDLKPITDGRTLSFARPEKALLDLLYLYPFYDSAYELENLRLDESYLSEDLNRDLLLKYTLKFKNKALERRVQKLMVTYRI